MPNYSNKMAENPLAGANDYEYDFFSGSQLSLMFGDVLIDNAVHMAFSTGASGTPVWGYANQYYSFVADGRILVQGTLTIAFKEAGYLLWPIQRFANKKATEEWTTPRYGVDKSGNITRGYSSPEDSTFTTAAREAEKKKIMRANVEQMARWEKKQPQKAGSPYNTFVRQLGALSDNDFEDWAEVFEDAIWFGSDTVNPSMRDRLFSKGIPDGIEIDNETVLSHRRADQYPPFDMWIIYGDINNNAANHTVQKILDAKFMGQSKVLEVSGKPVYEQYPFIARNVV